MTAYNRTMLIVMFIAINILDLTQSAKVVLLPFPCSVSHILQATNIGGALTEGGHDVYIALPTSYPHLNKHRKGPIKLFTYHVVEKDFFSFDFSSVIKLNSGNHLLSDLRTEVPGFQAFCHNLLLDQKLFEELQLLKADLFLLDAIPFWHCAYVLPYHLGVSYMSYGTGISPYWAGTPVLPSHSPFVYGHPYTEQMTFWERLDNLVSVVRMVFLPIPPYNTKDWSAKYAPGKPTLSLDELLKKSLFWFIHTDLIIDYPRPSMPNEAFIGGLTTGPAKPLPADLEEIVSSAEHGVIIMSFGSGLPDINSDRFLQVFRRLDQVVFWRHMSDYEGETPVPKNVHLLKWLPQNDLLGHNNTRLLITHGGGNGQFEAIYHGVPMISFPTFAEQPYNAKRMVYHGFGRALDLMSFTEYDLYEAITDVLNNPSYEEKIKQASRVYQQQMRPKEKVVYWVNHVLDYGAQHLMSYALEMPWYSYWMFDILAFFLLGGTFFITLCCCVCRRCCRRCCSQEPKQKKD